MVFVSGPEAATWVQLPEPRVPFKHPLSTVGFEHDFRLLKRVPFRDVDLEMHVDAGEAEFAELEPEWFEFTEPLDAGVDVRLLSEAVKPAFGVKFHRHPVVAGVTRNLFRATAQYTLIHKVIFSCRVSTGGRRMPARARQKQCNECFGKKTAAFHLRVLR